MDFLGIVIFVLATVISVVLHEFGHFITARIFKCKIKEFFVGFGYTIFSFIRNRTKYGLKLFLAGGYVRIAGTTPVEDDVKNYKDDELLYKKSLWKKIIVLVSGSFTHFILAFLCLLFLFTFSKVNQYSDSNQIGHVSPCISANTGEEMKCGSQSIYSPAYQAKLQEKDIILSVNGNSTKTWQDIRKAISNTAPNQELTLQVKRKNKSFNLDITKEIRDNSKFLGIQPVYTEKKMSISKSMNASLLVLVKLSKMSIDNLVHIKDLFIASTKVHNHASTKESVVTNNAQNENQNNTPRLTSIVGVAKISGQLFQNANYSEFIFIIANINIFFGIFNLVPIPPLDGGHILLNIIDEIAYIFHRDRNKTVAYNKYTFYLIYAIVAIFIISFIYIATIDLTS